MVNKSSSLDTVFMALSDPTRRAILERLTHSHATVSELAAPFAMSLPAVSKHLRVLESAGLIVRRIEGRIHYVSLRAETMQDATDWLNHYRQFWQSNFASLAAYLSAEEQEPRDESDV